MSAAVTAPVPAAAPPAAPRSRPLRILAGCASAYAGYLAARALASCDLVAEVLSTQIMVQCISSADIRWLAFRSVDDEATPPEHKVAIALGAVAQERAMPLLALSGAHLLYLALPIRRLLQRSTVAPTAPAPEQQQPATTANNSFVTGGWRWSDRTRSYYGDALLCCGVAGAAAWHVVTLPPAVFRHLCLPCWRGLFSNLPTSVQLGLHNSDLAGAVAVAAVLAVSALAWSPSLATWKALGWMLVESVGE